jgi:hypothetical protein
LVATSAALGGIAVAIWNRRTLAQMRLHSQFPDEYAVMDTDDEYE